MQCGASTSRRRHCAGSAGQTLLGVSPRCGHLPSRPRAAHAETACPPDAERPGHVLSMVRSADPRTPAGCSVPYGRRSTSSNARAAPSTQSGTRTSDGPWMLTPMLGCDAGDTIGPSTRRSTLGFFGGTSVILLPGLAVVPHRRGIYRNARESPPPARRARRKAPKARRGCSPDRVGTSAPSRPPSA